MNGLSEGNIRLDKWLKVARIYKTRTQASKACEERRVRVNGAVTKSAKMIKIGDRILVKLRSRYRELEVLGVAFKSLSAQEARKLYREETTQELPEEPMRALGLPSARSVGETIREGGKPTKKERRALTKIRGY